MISTVHQISKSQYPLFGNAEGVSGEGAPNPFQVASDLLFGLHQGSVDSFQTSGHVCHRTHEI